MKNLKSACFIFLWLITIGASEMRAQNWPCFRGPQGDGTCTETNLPLRWDSVTNVKWKVPVPGSGYSSPVVFNDRLFITTAVIETQEKILLCYDVADGKLLWKRTVVKSPFEVKNGDNSYASGTPATDGKGIFVSFLDGKDVVVAAYDFKGKQLWLQRPGTFKSPHGYSCSPLLFEDKVIINGSSQENPFMAALSKTDGKIVWKINHENTSHSFSTPIIRKIAGKTQMIFLGNREIASYNPTDGTKYWYVSGPSEDFCSSPVYNEKTGLVIVSSAWPKIILSAIRPDGKGDVTNSHVVWQQREGGYYVPSPVCKDNLLFATMTTGRLNCIDAATGKIIWTQNMGPQYASSVIAGGLIYMPKDDGVITVIKPGLKFESLARNAIGEKMFASPAISNGKIYLRGVKNLFCIATK